MFHKHSQPTYINDLHAKSWWLAHFDIAYPARGTPASVFPSIGKYVIKLGILVQLPYSTHLHRCTWPQFVIPNYLTLQALRLSPYAMVSEYQRWAGSYMSEVTISYIFIPCSDVPTISTNTNIASRAYIAQYMQSTGLVEPIVRWRITIQTWMRDGWRKRSRC